MEIILSSNCKSFTGSIGRGFGYSIQRRKNRFFAKRNSKGVVPPDGHWNFIVSCAELAKAGLHISDIKLMKERYYFTQLAGALERALKMDVGLEGLNILMHGFMRKGGINRETLRTRFKRDKEQWLTYYEARAFSEYAGYDLTAE